jgi:hypothetical protein
VAVTLKVACSDAVSVKLNARRHHCSHTLRVPRDTQHSGSWHACRAAECCRRYWRMYTRKDTSGISGSNALDVEPQLHISPEPPISKLEFNDAQPDTYVPADAQLGRAQQDWRVFCTECLQIIILQDHRQKNAICAKYRAALSWGSRTSRAGSSAGTPAHAALQPR